jgi:hypothetical protein
MKLNLPALNQAKKEEHGSSVRQRIQLDFSALKLSGIAEMPLKPSPLTAFPSLHTA